MTAVSQTVTFTVEVSAVVTAEKIRDSYGVPGSDFDAYDDLRVEKLTIGDRDFRPDQIAAALGPFVANSLVEDATEAADDLAWEADD